ncbi:MAG TPA: methyltransferase domain-containing protein [Telluria sp.]|jgi:2-polyprenyl-6-hydroxyphenyl methylase/3-demethylubiquinone-9 3-methyltransferase
MNFTRGFIEMNRRCSRAFDVMIVPEEFRVDGNRDFIDNFARKYLKPGLTVYDVGGGKQPYIKRETKDMLGLKVVGLDIDAYELSRAPQGLYDDVVCADITKYVGPGTADLLVCQALLEHVNDVSAAFRSFSSILRPGGRAVIFVPSRNAIFARLNLLLPENIKRWVLFHVFPESKVGAGFPSYYDRCTPLDFRNLIKNNGLKEIEFRAYYESAYFSFFFPIHIAWRLWMQLFRIAKGDQAAETFCLAFVKEPQN